MGETTKRMRNSSTLGNRKRAVNGRISGRRSKSRRVMWGTRAVRATLGLPVKPRLMVAELSLDEKIDASRVLTTYNRRKVLDAGVCSRVVQDYVARVIEQGKVETRLRELNRIIVKENMRINKPTEESVIAYRKLMNN